MNDPFTTSSEDEGYPSRSRERNHKALPPATLDLTDLSGSTTIGRHATMPIKTLHDEPREKCASAAVADGIILANATGILADLSGHVKDAAIP
ncbi:unnamed protein product [Dibothriocephalus latus]|uniref:Uncharacterized protein n=1 Tax=Dibothriocephalus latus TaxID=60516 RepID=A0A3P7LGQ5_DIBLA|nr:unnamed protein product [Dibothriocephalus latus]